MLTAYVVVAVLGGVISGVIAANRGVRPAFGYFIIGALIPILGVILAAVMKPPAALVLKCRRCNARQNVPVSATQWQCWQCGTGWQGLARLADPARPWMGADGQ